MPRHVDRAKLFLSFDALKGFSELIHNKEVKKVDPKELMSDALYELDWKIHLVKQGQMIRIIYYDKGDYIEKQGMVSMIDLDKKKIMIVKTVIDLKDIIFIDI